MPRHRGIWINPSNAGKHLEDNEERRIQITRAIDRNGFDWQVWAVAASGFFTDSYNLFATNVILPSLAFVYWSDVAENNYESYINMATLVGSVLGQITFGYLADRYGRRKLYGLELIVVIVATIGVVQSSSGYVVGDQASMNVLGWIMFWRILVGVGIGAEYPLSAVITAEFAPVQQRARMMAGVFLMQPIGQLAACLVGLGAVMGIGYAAGLNPGSTHPNTDRASQSLAVDSIWRVVIGVGAFPALVAILFRITIPESPRFTLDVEHDADRALEDTQMYYPSQKWDSPSLAQGPLHDEEMQGQPQMTQIDDEYEDIGWPADQESFAGRSGSATGSLSQPAQPKQLRGTQFTWVKIKQYFWTEGNWRYLAGTCLCWFVLDCAFYGLGINNPRTIASIWDASKPPTVTVPPPDWETDPDNPTYSIYQVLVQDAQQSAITISIGSVVGSLVLLKMIDYVPHKNFMAWSFLVLAALLAITGGSLFSVFRTDQHAVTIVFYALSQFVFNLGPNTLTFIIPAEIFPTRYRATCHGLSAASGKLGSIIIQVILWKLTPTGINITDSGKPQNNLLAIILIVFSFLMALGALFAWLWLPDIQLNQRTKSWKLPSKTLEELARGRAGVKEQGARNGRAAERTSNGRETGGFWRERRRRRRQQEE